MPAQRLLGGVGGGGVATKDRRNGDKGPEYLGDCTLKFPVLMICMYSSGTKVSLLPNFHTIKVRLIV